MNKAAFSSIAMPGFHFEAMFRSAKDFYHVYHPDISFRNKFLKISGSVGFASMFDLEGRRILPKTALLPHAGWGIYVRLENFYSINIAGIIEKGDFNKIKTLSEILLDLIENNLPNDVSSAQDKCKELG